MQSVLWCNRTVGEGQGGEREKKNIIDSDSMNTWRPLVSEYQLPRCQKRVPKKKWIGKRGLAATWSKVPGQRNLKMPVLSLSRAYPRYDFNIMATDDSDEMLFHLVSCHANMPCIGELLVLSLLNVPTMYFLESSSCLGALSQLRSTTHGMIMGGTLSIAHCLFLTSPGPHAGRSGWQAGP